ncbi:MAG TPA: hypothetical protein VFI65_09280 [Streptosporangiaceae bacterium]|nr:hypothetical protein [Streptosporangiaceae bacterium]
MLARPGIDAIFVPTARPPEYLRHVADLALDLNCPLVTMHSGRWTSAASAASYLFGKLGWTDLDLIAIDVPDPNGLRLPHFDSSKLLAGTAFERRTDLSTKRNLALAFSRLLGWTRILFFDDDITGLKPRDALDASGLLSNYNAVGLRIGGFPDHSVVCHAFRNAGGEQKAFIGGGALAVAANRTDSFFPDIYNDDWFFLLNAKGRLQPTAATGEVIQHPYDPFRNPGRARAEELGDVLAEGIYWLLDQGGSIADADAKHWKIYLGVRYRFITDVLGMVQAEVTTTTEQAAEKERKIAALKGAIGRLALITPKLCEDYLRAWSRDRQRWHDHIDQLDSAIPLNQALHLLSSPSARKLTWEINRRLHGRQPISTAAAVSLTRVITVDAKSPKAQAADQPREVSLSGRPASK